MYLTIQERLILGGVLPQQGNYTTMIAVKEIKDMIAITKEEIEKYQIIFTEQMVTWSEEGNDYEIYVDLGATLSVVINEALQAKNKANELTEQMVSLYEKFVTQA